MGLCRIPLEEGRVISSLVSVPVGHPAQCQSWLEPAGDTVLICSHLEFELSVACHWALQLVGLGIGIAF